MSLSIPTTYAGRYEIMRPIGEGAFSQTFLARDTTLQRDVALKVLRREHQSNNEFAARFDREAQAAARVSHPNVVPVFDFGREQQLPFIVMQYIDGQTLRAFARDEGPLTTEEVVNIGRQVLDGLAAIHDQGIIHRDVKPQNVLLDRRMVARLTDFGVAHLNNDVTLTETGTTIGTAAYMAPEQATGQSIGPEADLYATGVMLYELLTGRLPFRGDNPVQVLYRHVSDLPPRPRDLNPRIPIELEAVVLRALAKIPSERFRSAREMRDALSGKTAVAAPTGSSETVRPQPRQFSPPPAASAVTPPAAPTRKTPTARPLRKRRRRTWLLPVTLAIAALVVATVAFALSGLDLGGRSGDADDGIPAAAEATPTSAVAPVAAGGAETATEAVAAAATAEPTTTSEAPPEPTEEPLPGPTATQPPTDPTATAPPAGGGAPSVDFNTPIPVAAIPAVWQQGATATFTRDDFVAGGAYRRTDGELYGRPAAHLYSQETEYPQTTVAFTVGGQPELPDSYIGIVIIGMDDELPGKVPCRLSLNGVVIWEGPAPFGDETWTEVGWRVGNLELLQPGNNRLTFEVLSESGDFGLPPWLLLNQAAVYWD